MLIQIRTAVFFAILYALVLLREFPQHENPLEASVEATFLDRRERSKKRTLVGEWSRASPPVHTTFVILEVFAVCSTIEM